MERELEQEEELVDAKIELVNKETEARLQATETQKMSTSDYVNFATSQAQQLSNSIIGYQQQQLQFQLTSDLEKARSRGASEKEIEKIQKESAKKQKNLALIQATINTALAVTSALTLQPFWVGIVMAVVAAALGAVEIATISSASFAKGTKDSGPQWLDATVGEKGTEQINFADGTSMLTPNGSTKMFLPPHSEVVPNHRLQRDLAELQRSGYTQQNEEKIRKEENDRIIKAIKNRDETFVNITENGVSVTAKKGNDFYKYIGRKYRS